MFEAEGDRAKPPKERLASEDCVVVSPWLIDSLMEDLLDKLKILDYDTEYVTKQRMKPLTRHYFAIQTNPGEQFHAFTTIAAWLIRTLGRPFEQPQEYDDPNSTIAKILEMTKQLGLSVQCPPNKLKQGFGEHVIVLLRVLADAAVKAVDFRFEVPEVVERVEELGGEDGGAEIFLEKVEEEMYAGVSDEDDDDLGEVGPGLGPRRNAFRNGPAGFAPENSRPNGILESDFTLDVEAWYAEVEAVTPSLRYVSQSSRAGWMSNFAEMAEANAELAETVGAVNLLTSRLKAGISADIDKVVSKENHTAARVEEQLTLYKMLSAEAAEAKRTYEQVSGGVKQRLKTLADIGDRLESTKQEMDERGASMTDGSPLVAMKRAIAELRAETRALDLRVGILEHNLLQARVRKKTRMQREMSGAEAGLSPTNRAV